MCVFYPLQLQPTHICFKFSPNSIDIYVMYKAPRFLLYIFYFCCTHTHTTHLSLLAFRNLADEENKARFKCMNKFSTNKTFRPFNVPYMSIMITIIHINFGLAIYSYSNKIYVKKIYNNLS